jgi:hypothetical protein
MAIDDLDLPLSSMFSFSWLLSAIFFSCWSSHCGVSCLYLVDSSVLARSLGCDDVHDSWFFSCCYALISMLFTPFFFSFWEHAIWDRKLASCSIKMI